MLSNAALMVTCNNRVGVTGRGVVAPNGIGKNAFWNSLLEGRSGVGPITLVDASKTLDGRIKDSWGINTTPQ